MRSTQFIKTIPFFVGTLLFLLVSFTALSSADQEIKNTEGIEVFVVSNGVHTDLVLPVKNDQKDWRGLFSEELFKVENQSYSSIAFGWGNKDFYINTPTWGDLTVSTAVKAGLGLGSSAMHVRYMRSDPKTSDKCVSLHMTRTQYAALVKYIEQSFCLNGNCAIKIDHPGYGDHDLFFEAQGKYTLFRTCNVWTNNALKKAGIKTAIWTPFADGLIKSLQ